MYQACNHFCWRPNLSSIFFFSVLGESSLQRLVPRSSVFFTLLANNEMPKLTEDKRRAIKRCLLENYSYCAGSYVRLNHIIQRGTPKYFSWEDIGKPTILLEIQQQALLLFPTTSIDFAHSAASPSGGPGRGLNGLQVLDVCLLVSLQTHCLPRS